jgi:hypothetical protein
MLWFPVFKRDDQKIFKYGGGSYWRPKASPNISDAPDTDFYGYPADTGYPTFRCLVKYETYKDIRCIESFPFPT